MSTHIQFQSCVIQLPFQNRYGRNVYLAMAEGGDNNLIDNDTKRIARRLSENSKPTAEKLNLAIFPLNFR